MAFSIKKFWGVSTRHTSVCEAVEGCFHLFFLNLSIIQLTTFLVLIITDAQKKHTRSTPLHGCGFASSVVSQEGDHLVFMEV